MDLPEMTPTNVLAAVVREVDALRAEVRRLRSASGTLDQATIYKGGLTILDPESTARAFLGRGSLMFWDDYATDPDGYGRVYIDPVSGLHYMRMFPPHSAGDGLENSLTLRGSAPGVPGAVWIYTDGTLVLSSDGRTTLDTDGGLDLLTGGSLRLYELPTTGSAANLRLETAGGTPVVQYVTSSLRYKDDPAAAVIDSREVLRMQGRTWVDKGTVDRLGEDGAEADIPRNVGFIAEELDELPSMRQFVDYDDEGRPDAIQYDRLTVALLQLAKDQQTQLDALTARLDALDGGTPDPSAADTQE